MCTLGKDAGKDVNRNRAGEFVSTLSPSASKVVSSCVFPPMDPNFLKKEFEGSLDRFWCVGVCVDRSNDVVVVCCAKGGAVGNGVGVLEIEAIAAGEFRDDVLTLLIGECRAGCANGARRRFCVEGGTGLFCEENGVLDVLSCPLECLSGRPGVRAGVLEAEKGDKAYDMDVAAVVAVATLSLLLRLAVLLSENFFFRTVAGGFKSIMLIPAPCVPLLGL